MPLAVVNNSLKTDFQEMEKLLPMEGGNFENWEKNGFHWSEASFPLARMKNLFQTTFPLDEKKQA